MEDQFITLKDANGKYCTFKLHEFYEQLVKHNFKLLGLSLSMITELKRFCDLYYIKDEQDLINLQFKINV